MKKITLTLLALVCALCCTFGLVACGNENDGKSKPDNEQPIDTHQVSAYEWDKAFANVTKFTLLVTDYNCNSSGSIIGDGDLTEIYMYDGTNYRAVVYSSNGRRESYLTKQTSGWKDWIQSGDKWIGSMCTDKTAENYLNQSLNYLNTYKSMESEKDLQKYVPYEYENGTYVRKDETYVTFWIRDDDGRLTGAYDKKVTISQVIVEFDNRALVSVTLTGKHADKQDSPTGYGLREYKFTFDTKTIQLPYGVN